MRTLAGSGYLCQLHGQQQDPWTDLHEELTSLVSASWWLQDSSFSQFVRVNSQIFSSLQ